MKNIRIFAFTVLSIVGGGAAAFFANPVAALGGDFYANQGTLCSSIGGTCLNSNSGCQCTAPNCKAGTVSGCTITCTDGGSVDCTQH